jgi:hypothetical protein
MVGLVFPAFFPQYGLVLKIARNALCPCGSGKKYKHCCGALDRRAIGPYPPSARLLRELKLQARRQEAKEHRRRLLQGLGRPIIAAEANGYRLVVVGNKVHWSKTWATFQDFLIYFLKSAFTFAWGVAENAKPDSERHPLVSWLAGLDKLSHTPLPGAPTNVYSARMTGRVKALLSLAYDLYLCAHNAELPELLLTRLRNRKTFEGALYEAYVIANFAKAGFAIELEDEGDSTRSHCEFTATHRDTGRKFSVEAKAVASLSKRAGSSELPPKIRHKIFDALAKKADHERIVFIELARSHSSAQAEVPDWIPQISQEVLKTEGELTIEGQPAPPAYIFVTNRAFLHALDSDNWSEVAVPFGFKLNDFPGLRIPATVIEAVQARARHIELHWLLKAMETHHHIPSTFDERTLEEVFSQGGPPRLQIGETYLVPDGSGRQVPGVLQEAIVKEEKGDVVGVYQLADGRSIMCSGPLTEAELAIHRSSPETFFGVVEHVPKPVKTPLELFDYFFETYSRSTREKLLELMTGWPNFEALRNLSRSELAEIYCAEMASQHWLQFKQPKQAWPPK